jgi:hypothetical protein
MSASKKNAEMQGTIAMDTSDDVVGYRKPPRHAQFRKGTSGNPKGRPKSSENLATVLAAALREKVVVTANGKSRTVTKLNLAVMQLVDKATSGDMSALRQLTALVGAIDQEGANDPSVSAKHLSETDRKVVQGVLRRLENFSEEDKNDD